MLRTSFQKLTLGDSVKDIMWYWFPELISLMILVVLPPIVDSYLISNTQSLTSYGAVATITNVLYMLVRSAESIPIALIAIVGRHNGSGQYEKCGEELGISFWTTFFIGFIQFIVILCFARSIYEWLNVPQAMITVGVPFLRLKSFGIFLTFIMLSFIGFMRAVKNTHMPMMINVIGILTFIFFDYALILGKWGFPKLDIYGSAVATILQYTVANGIAIGYILMKKDFKKYFNIMFFSFFDLKRAFYLINLSWPILIDKSIFAAAYVWLSKMTSDLGPHAIATFDVVKNLERLAFLPAMAFASVITFLVSNRLGLQDPDGASSSIKKVLILAAVIVSTLTLFICFNAEYFIGCFDPRNEFTQFAMKSLFFISVLTIFDYVQVILAGALRGAGDVKAVMWGRLFTCTVFFIPVSYFFHWLPMTNTLLKFNLIYGSYYLMMGVMAIIFLARAKSHKWQKRQI